MSEVEKLVERLNAKRVWKREDYNDALATLQSQSRRVEELEAAGAFLLDRLTEFEDVLTADPEAREFYGHVSPAIARFRSALQSRDAHPPSGVTAPDGEVGDGGANQ